jgi:hypothetical protein
MGGFSELEGGHVRASDRDRARVASELRVHCVEGRITVEELETRLDQAMSARTIHELATVVHDLPKIRVPTEIREPRGVVRAGPPGVHPFTRRILVPASLTRTHAVALDTIAPGLNGYGYELKRSSSQALEFERHRSRALARVVAVLLFPIGLLALLGGSGPERVVITFEPHGTGETTMVVHGRATRRVRKAFAELSFG